MNNCVNRAVVRIGSYFRKRRMTEMMRTLNVTDQTTILDVGGRPSIWIFLPFQPRLTFINLQTQARGYGSIVVGDGCKLPFLDNSFDLCFSNSVIEHVGGHREQMAFAAECRRVGSKYYIQTPNYWFPIEPHFMAPFVHWLSPKVRVALVRYLSVPGRLPAERFVSLVEEVRLLTKTELQEIMPDACITHERFLGLSKSLIATGPRV